jgi:hypothetical protein
MNTTVIDMPSETIGRDVDAETADVRCMTQGELQRLGVSSVVYLRPGMIDGQMAYAIHGADGCPMAVVEDIELAVELVSEHGMAFVAVH